MYQTQSVRNLDPVNNSGFKHLFQIWTFLRFSIYMGISDGDSSIWWGVNLSASNPVLPFCVEGYYPDLTVSAITHAHTVLAAQATDHQGNWGRVLLKGGDISMVLSGTEAAANSAKLQRSRRKPLEDTLHQKRMS